MSFRWAQNKEVSRALSLILCLSSACYFNGCLRTASDLPPMSLERSESNGGTPNVSSSPEGGALAGAQAGVKMSAGEPAGGSATGGEPVAGSPVAGSPVAGDATAGSSEAGAMGGEPVLVDTAPLQCAHELCPMARLTSLEAPESAEQAHNRSCGLESSSGGSWIASILSLTGNSSGLNQFVSPDAEGQVSFVMFNQIVGWRSGQTGNETQGLSARFHHGVQEESGEFSFNPLSVPQAYPLSISNGRYQLNSPTFDMILPIVATNLEELVLPLQAVTLSGDIDLDQSGFNITNGVMEGYITQGSIHSILEAIYSQCDADLPPDLCGTLSAFLTGDSDADLGLILSILGDYDVMLDDEGVPQSCTGDQCNALSLCLFYEMTSYALP